MEMQLSCHKTGQLMEIIVQEKQAAADGIIVPVRENMLKPFHFFRRQEPLQVFAGRTGGDAEMVIDACFPVQHFQEHGQEQHIIGVLGIVQLLSLIHI